MKTLNIARELSIVSKELWLGQMKTMTLAINVAVGQCRAIYRESELRTL